MRKIYAFVLVITIVLFSFHGCNCLNELQKNNNVESTKQPAESSISQTDSCEIHFESLEDFLTAAGSSKIGKETNLSTINSFYLPDGLPAEYELYKIVVNTYEISFWYMQRSDLSTESTIIAAEQREDYFRFVSVRRDVQDPKGFLEIISQYGGTKKDVTDNGYYVPQEPSNLFIWTEDRDVLMLFVPKRIDFDDYETLFYTNRYLRNEDNSFRCFINHPIAFQSEESNCTIADDLEFLLVEESLPITNVTFQIHNPTDITYYYGRDYQFEILKDGIWYTTDYGTKDVPAELLSINPGEIIEETFYTHRGEEFSPNIYRVVKEFWKETEQGAFEKGIYVCGEFAVE